MSTATASIIGSSSRDGLSRIIAPAAMPTATAATAMAERFSGHFWAAVYTAVMSTAYGSGMTGVVLCVAPDGGGHGHRQDGARGDPPPAQGGAADDDLDDTDEVRGGEVDGAVGGVEQQGGPLPEADQGHDTDQAGEGYVSRRDAPLHCAPRPWRRSILGRGRTQCATGGDTVNRGWCRPPTGVLQQSPPADFVSRPGVPADLANRRCVTDPHG